MSCDQAMQRINLFWILYGTKLIINFLERTDFVLFQTLLLSNVNGDDRKNQQEALFYNNVYSPFNSAQILESSVLGGYGSRRRPPY